MRRRKTIKVLPEEFDKTQLVEKELVDKTEDKTISVVKQCKLLEYNRSNLFYIPMVNPVKQSIKDEIVKIFEDIPCYGYLKVHKELLERGHSVCINTVREYRKQLGLKAVLAVRPPNTLYGLIKLILSTLTNLEG